MNWILILIAVESANPVAVPGGDYQTMMDCFAAREYVMQHAVVEGPAQAVCIQTQNGKAVKATHREYMPH
ncbi:MAG: hypothetical protein OQK24_01980 [Magnetovibrio sp.]|nr:hypothetical protein [Magnetovibrio sp.]